MTAASLPEWLAAGAVGAGTLPLLAAAAVAANHDWHLPHLPLDAVESAAEQAAQRVRLQLAAWLLVLAWHLESGEAAR
ncbi:hypothetical protein [Streptomyces sp. MMS20-AI2-20]|uniref:hypothetical protein n=1 Tax=Streptomyces sp. MMS20-AI2-20 TaxID=2925835 RepID=UPI001F611101|nr:hypothetical protein [Streptomyces sp. MMS20-AI2-20]MCI4143018.1 hypothetical protein [Streptomyces sp. MMS20-AI2-20]